MSADTRNMKVFLDTNVLADFIFDRKPGNELADDIFWLGEHKLVDLQISLLSFVNTAYISKRYGVSLEDVKFVFRGLMDFVAVPDAGKEELEHALNSPLKDFEDAIQISYALEGEANVIVTNNKKDFIPCPIEVLTPMEFVEKYNNLFANN